MTAKQLHEITSALIAKGQGDIDVAINFATFSESENGTILTVESATVQEIQGTDDSGPTGPEFPFLVLAGGLPDV